MADLFNSAPPTMHRSARMSLCGTYRWTLGRTWAPGTTACWIMLNPSTADAMNDDPTIRRCIHFSRAWGHGRLVVVNLYPFRSSSPAECQRWADWEQNGPDWGARDELQRNIEIVTETVGKADQVIVAWGAGAWDAAWVEHVIEQTSAPLMCLRTTLSGAPVHPMARGKHRVPDDARPVVWRGLPWRTAPVALPHA